MDDLLPRLVVVFSVKVQRRKSECIPHSDDLRGTLIASALIEIDLV